MITNQSCGIALAACAMVSLAGPATAAERRFTIGSFQDVIVEGDARVTIEGKGPAAARATGEARDLDRVRLVRNGRSLRVGLDRPVQGSASGFRNAQPVDIRLVGRGVQRATLRGGGSLDVASLEGRDVRVMLLGAGTIRVGAVRADRMLVTIIGNGRVEFAAGSADQLTVDSNGAGTLEAGLLIVDTVKINQAGPATTNVNAGVKAEIFNNGAGTISVAGRADCFVRQAGSGSIACEKVSRNP